MVLPPDPPTASSIPLLHGPHCSSPAPASSVPQEGEISHLYLFFFLLVPGKSLDRLFEGLNRT